MVIVEDIELNPITKTAKVSLFADAKSEVTNGMQIDGVPADYTIEGGSTARTATWDVGTAKSNGDWSWAEKVDNKWLKIDYQR